MVQLNELSYQVIGLAFKVHSRFGPGLFESVYETGLADLMDLAGIVFERQKAIWVQVNSTLIQKAFRLDFLVEKQLVLEIKSAPVVDRTDIQQVLTYLRICKLRSGLILNYGTPSMGIRRVINGY